MISSAVDKDVSLWLHYVCLACHADLIIVAFVPLEGSQQQTSVPAFGIPPGIPVTFCHGRKALGVLVEVVRSRLPETRRVCRGIGR